MTWKRTKSVFKHKESSDPFLKTVKILSSQTNEFAEYKMKLDTGCEKHNLITLEAVNKLKMFQNIVIGSQSICTCLNGEDLVSIGTVLLSWKGKSFRKVFTTLFYVIDGGILPWEIILGAETIHEHGILKFAGFGGRSPVLPKKTQDEVARIAKRKQEQEKKAAANDTKVAADIKAKEEAARQSRRGNNNLSSGRHRS